MRKDKGLNEISNRLPMLTGHVPEISRRHGQIREQEPR